MKIVLLLLACLIVPTLSAQEITEGKTYWVLGTHSMSDNESSAKEIKFKVGDVFILQSVRFPAAKSPVIHAESNGRGLGSTDFVGVMNGQLKPVKETGLLTRSYVFVCREPGEDLIKLTYPHIEAVTGDKDVGHYYKVKVE